MPLPDAPHLIPAGRHDEIGEPLAQKKVVKRRDDHLTDGERAEVRSARERGDDAGAIVRETQERLAREAERYKDKGKAA